MIKIYFILLILFISSSVEAATYYVRVSGGTTTQCLGTTDADYDGNGTGEACAFAHPSWALGATGTSGVMVAGDTLMIDDTSSAQYMIGLGMPNTVGCTQGASYDCLLDSPPSGASSANPTRILGSSWNTGCATKPQLWGTQGAAGVLNISFRSNVEVQCLDITDHSACNEVVGNNLCNNNFAGGTSVGTWARTGIRGTQNANLTLKNIEVHGFARQGMLLGDLSGITTLDHVHSDGNGYNGWEGDLTSKGVGTNTGSINSGTINANDLRITFSGCHEVYPRSSSYTAADYSGCSDASQSNDWIGSNTTSGTWNITNSNISHNMSDGLDLRYCTGCAAVNIDKSIFEGNEGNNVKVTSKDFSFTNSINIANCNYFAAAGKVFSQQTPCRAGGVPFYLGPRAGGTFKIDNSTVYAATDSDTSAVMEMSGVGNPNGTETYLFRNNMFVAPTSSSGTNWVPFYNVSLVGAALTDFTARTVTNSLIYNFQGACHAGTGNVCTAPAWVGSISNGASSNLSNVYLSSNVGGGTSLTFWNTSKDYNNFAQLASIDKGALQYGSSAQLAQPGQACVATSDCSVGSCSNFVCSGSCTANGGACASGATCCSGTCTALVCAVPATCGDGVVQLPEVCDTSGPNLNGSNCILQGFTGGTLGCTAGCASFNTASCTSTLVFPLTPILDNFNRANEGPPPSSNWTTIAGQMTVVSNAAKGALSGNTHNRIYWNPTVFGADEEVYATIASKGGTSGDAVNLYLRLDPSVLNGYYVQYLENTAGTDSIVLKRMTAGSNTTIQTYSQEVGAGASIGLSAVGSTLKTYYKAAAGSWTELGSETNTLYSAGGAVGSDIAYTTTSPTFDNFGGGDLNPITCGNSLKEGAEVCDDPEADGVDLAGQTCVTQNYASGTLACLPNCTAFDYSGCVTASVCGNGSAESGEVCDLTDVRSQTCVLQGFASGTLTCDEADPLCQTLDTTECISSTSGASGGVALR